MAKRGTLGIDVGGTKTLLALFDESFQVIEEVKFKTQPQAGEKAFTERLTEAVEGLTKKAEKKEVTLVGVGVGCAGIIDNDKGTLKTSPNIPFLKDYPLRTRLSKLTGTNIYLANDAQAGLYGEQQLGAAVGRKNVIGIFIGTGLGGAIVIDGRLYLGANGLSGNIGHYLMHPGAALSGSEREGILDDIASRTAIAGEAAVLAAKQWAPNLHNLAGTDVSNIRSGDLAEAIEKGDKEIEKLVRARCKIAGIALSNIVDFLNPEMVVLGGGMVEAMPNLIRHEIKSGILENASPEARQDLEVVTAKLKSHSVTTGAAKLALDFFLNAQPESTAPRTKKVAA